MSRGVVATVGFMVSVASTGPGCGTSGAASDAAVPPADADQPPVIDAPLADASDEPPGVPDLQLVGSQMANSWIVDTVNFAPGDCAVVEGCVGGAGLRTLLRFTTMTANRGTGDLVVGVPPPSRESNEVFQWSECHKHHHFPDYTSYELVSQTGTTAGTTIIGRKQSFCLQDDEPVQVGAQPRGFSCRNQGLSRGWADIYTRSTTCQWIDVTDVAPGVYTLRVVVNPERKLTESDYSNNVFTVDVQF